MVMFAVIYAVCILELFSLFFNFFIIVFVRMLERLGVKNSADYGDYLNFCTAQHVRFKKHSQSLSTFNTTRLTQSILSRLYSAIILIAHVYVQLLSCGM